MDMEQLQIELRAFAKERDWEQFHNPKDLSVALSIEAAELLEHFLWMSKEEAEALKGNAQRKSEIALEVADILFYLVRFSDVMGIDLHAAATEKLRLNAEKYPIELSKGSSVKYSRRGHEGA